MEDLTESPAGTQGNRSKVAPTFHRWNTGEAYFYCPVYDKQDQAADATNRFAHGSSRNAAAWELTS
jgi:hypothetical protein